MIAVFQRAWTMAMRRPEPNHTRHLQLVSRCFFLSMCRDWPSPRGTGVHGAGLIRTVECLRSSGAFDSGHFCGVGISEIDGGRNW